ncbi:MAG: hypothetical protein IJF69_00360, partial [Clostridia bacterium]|nr:hypothetical protein [Clostridia bacterium]
MKLWHSILLSFVVRTPCQSATQNKPEKDKTNDILALSSSEAIFYFTYVILYIDNTQKSIEIYCFILYFSQSPVAVIKKHEKVKMLILTLC